MTTLPRVSLSPLLPAVQEGNAGATLMTFTVTLSAAATSAVSVGYTTNDGTALAGSDYTAATGTLDFAIGETSKTFTVAVTGDTTIERDEVFFVRLTKVSGDAALNYAASAAVATIRNDDAPAAALPSISLTPLAPEVTEGNSGTNPATFTVQLSSAATTAVTVAYRTVDGTAAAGSDYTATTGTLTFAPGETTKTIAVPVLGDTVVERDESFFLRLESPTGATLNYAGANAVATIKNDDVGTPPALPSLSLTPLVTDIAEGNSGTSLLSFTVKLSAAATSTVTVGYETEDGTAKAGSDFTATSGTLTFAPGEVSKTIAVPVLGDTTAERDESFFLRLEDPTGATLNIASAAAVATIRNDDGSPAPALPSLSLTPQLAEITEGNSGTSPLAFTVKLSAAAATTVTVDYKTTDGTAIAGSDYTATSGTLTFAPGETTKTFNVPVLGDTTAERDEVFFVNLDNPSSGATLGYAAAGAMATIRNDDAGTVATTPSFSITPQLAEITEGNSGTTPLAFSVKLSAAATTTLTVDYKTSNGTALAGSDYTAASGTLTFAPGETTKTFNVAVLGDTVAERDEVFFVSLDNPTGGATLSYGAAGAMATIRNDDGPAPRFAVSRDGRADNDDADDYVGPVGYLKYQMLGSARGEAVSGTKLNDFMNLLGGDDAADGADGDDVIDGGDGSNFLTGGAGRDVFFLDGRGGATTWATITDWAAGEELSLWGWRPGVSRATWDDRGGAAGWQGVTLHADLNGDGTIDTSVTWTGHTRGDLPAISAMDGLLWFHP